MKTPEEWLVESNDAGSSLEVLDLIRRIQQDAQPKWVTGPASREWPVGAKALFQQDHNSEVKMFEKAEYFNVSMIPESRFLRLDEILKQEWPKDSQAEIDRRELNAGNTPDRYGK